LASQRQLISERSSKPSKKKAKKGHGTAAAPNPQAVPNQIVAAANAPATPAAAASMVAPNVVGANPEVNHQMPGGNYMQGLNASKKAPPVVTHTMLPQQPARPVSTTTAAPVRKQSTNQQQPILSNNMMPQQQQMIMPNPLLSPPPQQQMPPQNQFKPLSNLPPSLIDPCAVGEFFFNWIAQ
jgi:hypothetical protein